MSRLHENEGRQVTVFIRQVEERRERLRLAVHAIGAGVRHFRQLQHVHNAMELLRRPTPFLWTHRGAPAEDRRIAGDATNGNSTEGHSSAEAEVDVGASIIFDARRIRRLRDESEGTGTIREQPADLIALHR
jgi:hypothetical protein